MDLIKLLTDRLNVQEEQAQGAVGLLFGVAKKNLEAGDFSKVAEMIPGLDSFIDASPDTGGGMMGAMGGLASAFGGDKMAGFADLASLSKGFSKLGLDPSMLGQFVPVILNFLQENGSDEIRDLFAKYVSPEDK